MSKKEILSTKDYEEFKRLKGNRAVETKRVEKIKKSINDVGYITSPILVNEKMEIIDGQGRFQALKELGMPIEYIVQSGIGIKECVSMNINQTNWNTKDYIKTYAERELESYIYLQKLQEEFPLITSLDVFVVSLFKQEKLPRNETIDGTLVITEEQYEEARNRLLQIYPIISENPKARKYLKFFKGLLICFWLDVVDVDLLLTRALEAISSNQIPQLSTTLQVIQYIESIYNRNKRSGFVYITTAYKQQIVRNPEKRSKKEKLEE